MLSRVFLTTFILFANGFAFAQSPSDAVLIERMRLNQSLYYLHDKGEDLRLKANTANSDLYRVLSAYENEAVCTTCVDPDPYNDPIIKSSSAHSDLVVRGVVVRSISGFTKNRAFIFTDEQFHVDSVLKQSQQDLLQYGNPIGKEVTVTMPGGHVKSDGHRISFKLTNFIQPQIGRTYILFLKSVPLSQSYELVDVQGFDVTDLLVQPLHPLQHSPEQKTLNDKFIFSDALQKSIAKNKEESGQ